MDEIQDIIAEIAINTGNAEKQLEALQRGISKIDKELASLKKGSDAYNNAISKQAVLQRQQQSLFRRYADELRNAEAMQEALNDELVRTTKEFGKESEAAKRATAAIIAQAAQVERLKKATNTIGSAKLGGEAQEGKSGLRGVTKVFTELRQTIGADLQGSVLGLTGNFGQLAMAIGGVGLAAGGIAAVAGAIFQLGQAAIKTAAKFERMATTLKTTFGSQGVAMQVQQQLIEFAAATPFGVEQITESYIKLANRGLKPSNEALTKLGDFAAATGKDMGQLVEAILDVNNTERWNEFGVKVSTAGNKIIGSFKGLTKEFERSEAGAMAMIEAFGSMQGVAGGMEAQSKTLEGQLSNLSDNLDQLYFNIANDKLFGVMSLSDLAKATVSGINSVIGALNEFNVATIDYGDNIATVYGGTATRYRQMLRQQSEIINKSKNEAATIESLVKEYNQLSAVTTENANKKLQMNIITGQLLALAGEEALVFNENSEVIGLNNEKINEAIRLRRILANTEIAAMVESVENVGSQVQGLDAQIQMARVAGQKELVNKLEEERNRLLDKQKATQKELAFQGISETEQAQALLVVQSERLKNELNILESKREALREQIAERNEAEAMTLLEREQARVALIQNNNLQKAEESRLKQQELAIKLDGQRRKLRKELEEALLNTANAERQINATNLRISDLQAKKAKEKNVEVLKEIDYQIKLAEQQKATLQTIIDQNNELKDRNKLLTGYDETTKTYSGGVLEETMALQQKELEMQRREALRAYQRELIEQRRKIQQLVLDVQEEEAKLLLEKTTERVQREFEINKKGIDLQRQSAIDNFKEETRNKGLKASEIAEGIKAINDKFRIKEQQAEEKLANDLFEIKKMYAEKERALAIERLRAEATDAQTLLSFSTNADVSQTITQRIFEINEQIRQKEFEAQKAALERELELAKGNAEAESRIKLDIQTLELKNIEARKAAELKLIDDIAKAREAAVKDEFALRAAIREQREGSSEAAFLEKEAQLIGVFFGRQRKLQRERDRELRKQNIARAKEQQELAERQLKETETLYNQELATFGQVRRETQLKYEQSLAAQIKADNEYTKTQNENSKKTLEERIATFEEIIGYTEKVANLTIDGIKQINAANEQRREKELQVATDRLNLLYRDLELGRQVNEEVIRREQERIQKINEERKRAAEQERALTLGQIILQQILAVASAAASAAKTTQWFTIPIAVASALLAITAGARQARASVAGFKKGVIRLQGGRDENADDTVPALLAKGESVMTVKETNRAEKILMAIRKGELSDKDLFGRGGFLFKERNVGLSQKTVENQYDMRGYFDRLISAVEGIPSVRVSADADGIVKYTTRRQKRIKALNSR